MSAPRTPQESACAWNFLLCGATMKSSVSEIDRDLSGHGLSTCTSDSWGVWGVDSDFEFLKKIKLLTT